MIKSEKEQKVPEKYKNQPQNHTEKLSEEIAKVSQKYQNLTEKNRIETKITRNKKIKPHIYKF